jgi:histone deacetylase 1/2
MLVYVDDIIITGSSSPHIKDLISNLNAQFSLKQLGQLDYFLGIEVSHLSNGSLFLSQTQCIRDLLTKTNMHEAKRLPTPMVGNLKLSKTGSDYLQDPTMYRSVVGALHYATITRPEISFLSTRPASSSLSN